MKIVDFRCPWGPNVLRIKEVPKPTLERHEILIQVAAAGLNVYDTWQRQGIPFYRFDFGEYLGYECSGKVVDVGSDVTKFKTGDEMHVAAGGIDVIAIQYAKHIGCEIFAVAGAQVCINYKKEDFRKRVKAETGEKGVDIILDVSGKDHFKKNLDCLARGGSLVILGHKSGDEVDSDLSLLMKKDVSVIGADIAKINLFDIEQLMSDAAAKFWPLIEAGHVKPIIGKIFTFSEAAKAHRALEKSSIPCKLLLVPPEATACDIHSPKIQGPINRFGAHFSSKVRKS